MNRYLCNFFGRQAPNLRNTISVERMQFDWPPKYILDIMRSNRFHGTFISTVAHDNVLSY